MLAINSDAARFQSARRVWEEAGDSLFAAAPDYLSALSSLNDIPATLKSPVNSRDLVSRIDQDLAKLGALANSRAILSRLRNRHNALINTLPVETLIRVFHIFVNQAQPILVSTNAQRPYLWSVVPFIEQDCERENNSLAGLWLERSADVPLHIIICHGRRQSITIAPMLAPYAGRFRTLSLVVESWAAIMECWLNHGVPGSLIELSVSTQAGHLPLLPIGERHSWESFFRPLRVLRLNNVFLDWHSAAFEGLLEFRLESTAALIEVTQLVRVLNASPGLTPLRIKQIRFSKSDQSRLVPISLPCLCALYLDDIAPDYLDIVLRLIEPGPYDVHLNFSMTSLSTDESGGLIAISGLHPIFPLLQQFNVSTLSLERHCQANDLRILLRSLPRLHTIYLQDLHAMYDAATFGAMTKSPRLDPADTDLISASLRAIHLAGTITDREAFKAMIRSHPLDQLSLCGRVLSPDAMYYCPADEMESTDELYIWLSSRVRNFECIGFGDVLSRPLRLHPFRWKLW